MVCRGCGAVRTRGAGRRDTEGDGEMDRDRQEQTHQDAEIETVGEGRLRETGDAERQRQICERQRDRISWAETMGETEPPGVSGGVRSFGPRGCRCQPAPWPSTPGDWPVCPPHRCFPAGVWGRFAVGWAWGMRGCREQVSVGASVHAGVWMGRWPGSGGCKGVVGHAGMSMPADEDTDEDQGQHSVHSVWPTHARW